MTYRNYQLACRLCGRQLDDDGIILACDQAHGPALLATEYSARQLQPDERAAGIYRYRGWLPIAREIPGSGRTALYQSERLSRLAGLPQLWVAFNGYWPERGATFATASFKELEAYAVLARLSERQAGVLVVASAGNTAAAFARVCSQSRRPCLIVVPARGMYRMQFVEPLDPCVRIVALAGNADYYDAILFAESISRLDGFFPEGGARNVARRDGIGTTMLAAVEAIGRLPDYYVQAIGSGTGAIAAHEAARRLIGDARYGDRLPRLLLSQNSPFTPIQLAWRSRQRELAACDRQANKQCIQAIDADVLSNERPPYAIAGGLFDALSESEGEVLAVDNCELREAAELFHEAEGIDIDPASGVALASLLSARRAGLIDGEALVLLHITGGGWQRCRADLRLAPVEPALVIDAEELGAPAALERAARLFF